MHASKENARMAREIVEILRQDLGYENQASKVLAKVEEFLEAAERKLPTEAAFSREKARKTAKA